jgi:hypothetical protein
MAARRYCGGLDGFDRDAGGSAVFCIPARWSRERLEAMSPEDLRIQRALIGLSAACEREESERRWSLAKQTMWLVLLVGGYLLIYLLDLLHLSFELLGIGF